ncbi:LuxR family transcriptional regulator [Agromyces binzhouensis]|uniref:LuxR family transcriptional regulator n=1 Tax=Agromyces binzhouensis TaxID=1817495 RepID=A0A4Q2JK52_9MICO|nr:LuxR family transcriptional regulator [Agromyces binzhouensis]
MGPDARLDRLTDRESAVLALVAAGRSNPAIARELHVSLSAVEKHVNAIFQKLELQPGPDTHRRVAASVAYLRDRP